jgi:general secretion pathway protein F
MRFRVKALGPAGDVRQLTIDGNDADAARRQAQARGLAVLSVRSLGSTLPWLPTRQPIRLTLFSQECMALLGAGLSVMEAVDVMLERSSAAATAVLQALRADLNAGHALSSALQNQPGVFPALYVATVRAAERSGDLVAALERYTEYQRRIDDARSQLRRAALYPLVLLGAGLAVALFMLLFVVPRFASVYEDIGGQLPWLTQALLGLGRLLGEHLSLVLGLTLLGTMLGLRAAARADLRRALRTVLTRVPMLGRRWHDFQLTRLLRTLAMLLRSGIAVSTALEMSQGLLDGEMRAGLGRALDDIRSGQPLSQALERNGLSTEVSRRLLVVGERTGRLAELVERSALFQERELQEFLDGAIKLVEPVLMLLIGGLIGLIVILLYMPIFEIASAVG